MAGSTSSDTFVLSTASLKLDDASSLEPHISALTSATASSTIKHINLSGNTIGVPAAQHLSTHLSKLASLQTANLADLFTGRLLHEIPPAIDALLTALLPLKDLHTVNLSDNAFGLNTAQPLVKFLEKHTPLRNLILNNNGLGPEAGTLVADAISRLAEAKQTAQLPPLETIICGRNRLEAGSMAAWAKALVLHKEGVREVRMVQNGIRQEGIQLLLRSGLRYCSGLKRMDLQDNTFTKSGALALAEVVSGWNNLEELGVGDSLLGDRGMVLVADALGKGNNEKLEVLRLTYNDIQAKGVRALVDAVKKGVLLALRKVELNGNKFAEEDPAVEELRMTLDERKEKAGEDVDEADWGLDELSDLEEESDDGVEDDDEDEDEDEDEGVKEKADRELKQADEAEGENVAQEKDNEVDDLADKLGKTGI